MKKSLIILFILSFCLSKINAQLGEMGPNDTIKVLVYKIGTDSFAYKYGDIVTIQGVLTPSGKQGLKDRRSLRRFVEETYPLAIEASNLIIEIRKEKEEANNRKEKRKIVKSSEKEIKSKFADRIKNMYIGEGKVLMKLIYRESGITCYDIIKEMKSGFNARLWQTLSYFFDGNLKQTYDPYGDDWEIEKIVRELAKLYGRT